MRKHSQFGTRLEKLLTRQHLTDNLFRSQFIFTLLQLEILLHFNHSDIFIGALKVFSLSLTELEEGKATDHQIGIVKKDDINWTDHFYRLLDTYFW